jgi:hypothetical protein
MVACGFQPNRHPPEIIEKWDRKAPATDHLDECLELIGIKAAHGHKIRLTIPSK